ncbi:MAG: AtpZ/AtpI family protein [Gammaproteobacteria bacterium]|nr:AtpZ/AtpI family protein [Gammaproteobacteria bacterium]
MAEAPRDGPGDPPGQRFEEEVRRKAGRKLRARREEERTAWFWLGMFGLVGWSVAVPTVIGVALGVWIDHQWPGRVSWTLTLLFAGVMLGCVNAWYWVKQESRRR